MRNILTVFLIPAFLGFSHQTWGADKTFAQLDGRFGSTIQPFLQTYCVTCHGGEKPKGELDLSAYSSLAAVVKDARRWDLIIERLKAEEMPPHKAKFYPFLEVREAHHGASHNDTSEGYERIARFHLSQLAYLAKRLDEMPEGEGTVLDNSCLMFISNMWSGTKHDNKKVPVVTVGGLGGTLQTGRSLNYLDSADENRKLCSLYLGIMDRMGVRLDHFGDADIRLASL